MSTVLGQYDLQIRYAKSLDEGQYVCQLLYKQKTYFSQTANVRVLGKTWTFQSLGSKKAILPSTKFTIH